jgi:hypothetical protein
MSFQEFGRHLSTPEGKGLETVGLVAPAGMIKKWFVPASSSNVLESIIRGRFY